MIAIGRRTLRLSDPPGATVTIGAWTLDELERFTRVVSTLSDAARAEAMFELFVVHIERHPFEVAARDLDAIALMPIVRLWMASVVAPPPLRGPRH